jgi:lysine 6-dehydrogenase
LKYRYVVLGAGRQGVALAYDLARHCEAAHITLADQSPEVAHRAVSRLQSLLTEEGAPLAATACDVSQPADVARVIGGADVVASAVPYRFNAVLTDLAIAAGASFCDLGGNTAVVRRQLARHPRAAAAGVSIVPDCGLAPGLGNLLAAHGIAGMDEPQHVHIRCGGLPESPVGPLAYKLSFSFDGLINEYSGHGEFLRDGQPVNVEALSELEDIDFPAPIGRCEAAVTSGGTSTGPDTFRGRLQTYDYKTVRYPGHFAVIRALFALGCFDEQVKGADGTVLRPREALRRLFEERLAFPEVPDVVVLRCTVRGRHKGAPLTRQYDLLEWHDERTGFTAMERATAFPAALVAYMQARGLIAPGARPAEVAVPLQQYLDELPRHGIRVATQT